MGFWESLLKPHEPYGEKEPISQTRFQDISLETIFSEAEELYAKAEATTHGPSTNYSMPKSNDDLVKATELLLKHNLTDRESKTASIVDLVTIYTFDSWGGFYKAPSRIKDDPLAIILIYGGINDRDIETQGLIAVHGGINQGNITANYVMYGGGINQGNITANYVMYGGGIDDEINNNEGTIWAKKGFWRGGGIFPNVFVGPDKEPFDEKTYSSPTTEKIFNDFFKGHMNQMYKSSPTTSNQKHFPK